MNYTDEYVCHLKTLFILVNSKRDNELLLKLIANLNMLLKDESVNVQKKAILTLTQLYKVALQVMSVIKSNYVFDNTECSSY